MLSKTNSLEENLLLFVVLRWEISEFKSSSLNSFVERTFFSLCSEWGYLSISAGH